MTIVTIQCSLEIPGTKKKFGSNKCQLLKALNNPLLLTVLLSNSKKKCIDRVLKFILTF